MALLDVLNLTTQIEGFEWIILLVIIAALFLFGPQKIPELARGFGRALGEFQRGRMEIERELRGQLSEGPRTDTRSQEERIAVALGLLTTGKSDAQLKIEIARAIDTVAEGKVTAAAAAIGAGSADADIQTLRERILKALVE